MVEEFRLKFSINKGKTETKPFIESNFESYNLFEFDEFKDSINKAAYDDNLYRSFPILLRTLFESLLWYIFRDGLAKIHTDLFFNKKKNRIRDFTQLISLLNFLKDSELIPYCKKVINQNIIETLKLIKDFGNWNVHDIHNHVRKDFADEWKEKINHIISAMLLLYKNIKNKEIIIIDERLKKLNEHLGIKSEKYDNQKSQELLKLQEKVINANINHRDFKGFKKSEIKDMVILEQDPFFAPYINERFELTKQFGKKLRKLRRKSHKSEKVSD